MDWVSILRVLGFLTIIAGIILSFIASNAQAELNQSLGAFGIADAASPIITWIIWVLGGTLSSVIWFVFAVIVENQERLEQRLIDMQSPPKPTRRISTGDYPSQQRKRAASGGISWPDR